MTHSLETALQQIYGSGAAAQMPRYQQARQAFTDHFGDAGELLIFRAPGRVNLIGEHTDYNHGFVLPAALDKDVLLFVRPRADDQINLVNLENEFALVSFTLSEAIPSAPVGDWSNYARGAAQTVTQQLGQRPPGFDGLVVSAAPQGIPRGAGLSSSSALTVVVAVALAHLADWQPLPVQLAHLCSDAEWYVGTRGGIMDQFAALLGRRDHALFLDCRPDAQGNYTYEAIPLPTTHRLLVVDSGVHHRNVRGEFNQRVAACRAGVGLLRRDFPGITHLRDVQDVAWEILEPLLPETITATALQEQGIDLGEIPGLDAQAGLRVRACCRHVWTENDRVRLAMDALRLGETKELGRLMNEAHTSARDDYRISCPELEVLIESANQVEGVAGARLTGAGWGGCIIALVDKGAVEAFQTHVQERYKQATGREASIFPCQAGPGAGLVGR
ncbi:MAG: galactokinase [Chloroflexi bacterium]|nr:galactokinase [Chloroflexota bacterium]